MDENFNISYAMKRAMYDKCHVLFDQMMMFAEMRKREQEDGYDDITDTVKGLKSLVHEKLDYLTDGADFTIKDLGYCEPNGLNEFLVKFNLDIDGAQAAIDSVNSPSIKNEYMHEGLMITDNKKRYATVIPIKESLLSKDFTQKMLSEKCNILTSPKYETDCQSQSPVELQFPENDFLKIGPDDIRKILDKLNIEADSLDILLRFESGTTSGYLSGKPIPDNHNELIYTVFHHIDAFKIFTHHQ